MRLGDMLAETAQINPTIEAGRSVAEAVERMTGQGVRALVVVEGGRPVGMFTSRDFLRCGRRFPVAPFEQIDIRDVMAVRLVAAEADDTVGSAVDTMIRAGIHHLPVLADGRVLGVLTLGGLVRRHLAQLAEAFDQLQAYIADLQSAAED